MDQSADVISHWHHSVEDFNTSSVDFYEAVKKDLESTKAPVRFDAVEWSEGGIVSAKRRYLRVEYDRFTFDICAAPFGTRFFFSWWLAKRQAGSASLGCLGLLGLTGALFFFVKWLGLTTGILAFIIAVGVALIALRNGTFGDPAAVEDVILALPVMGPIYQRLFRPVTYYSVDTRIMFEEAVHSTVLKLIDGLLAAKGARVLSPEESKPTTRDILR